MLKAAIFGLSFGAGFFLCALAVGEILCQLIKDDPCDDPRPYLGDDYTGGNR